MNLDTPDNYRTVDKAGMMDRILRFPDQLTEADNLVARANLSPADYQAIEHIVVAGMGGSGVPGDFLQVLLGRSLAVPLLVNKGYGLPAFVGPASLVLTISYSGATEETLSAFNAARRAGAKIVAITSGDKLRELSEEHHVPAVLVPARSQPRASFGHLLSCSLLVLEKLGLSPTMQKDRTEAAAVAAAIRDELHPSVPTANNLAKQIASSLIGTFPVIYGTRDASAPVALRWQQQINENSKMLAHHHEFPELDHNEMAVWQLPQAVHDQVKLIFLRAGNETEQMRRRIEVTRSVLEQRGQEVREVWSKGESLLARLASLSHIGDFVSFYLAMLGEVDPTPVEAIAFLKSELSKPPRSPR